MLAAALLAWLWAQAEQAPAAPPPPQPPATAGPATAAPAPSGPALPAPAAPGPALPAPAAPGPAATAAAAVPPPVLDNALGVYGSFAYRLGSDGQSVGPRAGFSIGGDYERRYFATPAGFELAGGLDFFYDRFATDLAGSPMLDPGLSERMISQTSFALIQTAAWRIGRVHPFAKAGLGVTIAYFSSPEILFRPGSFDAVQPLVRGAAGLDLVVYRNVAVSLQAAYTHLFTNPVFTSSDGTTYALFGDLLDLGLGMVMQF